MSNLETAKRTADILGSRALEGLQTLLADDFRAKGAILELTKQQILDNQSVWYVLDTVHTILYTPSLTLC